MHIQAYLKEHQLIIQKKKSTNSYSTQEDIKEGNKNLRNIEGTKSYEDMNY